MVNAEMKADAREKFGALGEALADTRLHPIDGPADTVAAVYRDRPARDAAGRDGRATPPTSRAQVAARRRRRQLQLRLHADRSSRASSSPRREGALIDQSFALTQGSCTVVAVDGEVSQDLYDVDRPPARLGDPGRGVDEPLMRFPPFARLRAGLAREAVALARAPVAADLGPRGRRGHRPALQHARLARDRRPPGRARPRRSRWRRRTRALVAPRAASPSTSSAGASPRRWSPRTPIRRCRATATTRYDHEGTPARRVVHIDRGIFTRLHEQPPDRGRLRRRAQRPLEGHRRVAGPPDPHVEHGVRGGRRDPAEDIVRRSTTATTSPATGSRRSPRAARTSASPRAASTRSANGRARAGSTATAASPRTRATIS